MSQRRIESGARALRHAWLLFALLLLSSGCYGMHQLRASARPTPQARDCKPDSAPAACSFMLTQRRDDPDKYTLAVLEFDDQGTAYAPAQLDTLIHLLSETSPSPQSWKGQIVITFAHGWFRDARPGDPNLVLFGQILELLSASEINAAKDANRVPRRVVGVYLGWRGASSKLWGAEVFTFWNRKETAHRIGQREATVALTRIRRAVYEGETNDAKRNRLVVMGHSFGAAMVYSALSPLIANTMLSPDGPTPSAPPVADAIILFNPAFEAALLHHVLHYARPRHDGGPLLSLFTSKSDAATRVAFRIGRRFDTVLLKHRDFANPIKPGMVSEKAANLRTIGHFEPYLTHDLSLRSQMKAPCEESVSPGAEQVRSASLHADGSENEQTRKQLGADVQRALRAIRHQYDQGEAMTFGPLCLTPRADLDPSKKRLPVLNVSMDKDLWNGHGVEQTEARRQLMMSFMMLFVPFTGLPAAPVQAAEAPDDARTAPDAPEDGTPAWVDPTSGYDAF